MRLTARSAVAALAVVSSFLASAGLPAAAHAQVWGEFANISSTMGVNDGRICTGESSRGDIGCAANAPYISRTTGFLGIGTSNPIYPLDVSLAQNVFLSLDVGAIGRAAQLRLTRGGSNQSYIGLGASNVFAISTYENIPITLNNNNYAERLRITPNGLIGISTTAPSTTLHVAGTIRIAADPAQTCDINRLGAIKYETGNFMVCRSAANGWEALTTSGPNTLADRIVSGSAYVQANGPGGNVTISGTTYIGYNTATAATLEVGFSPTGNRAAAVDLTGDSTYSNYGLRLIRGNTGANADSELIHRGTGSLNITTTEQAPINLRTNNADALQVLTNGSINIPSGSFNVTTQAPSGIVASFQVSNSTAREMMGIYGYHDDDATPFLQDTMMLYTGNGTKNLQITAAKADGVVRFTTGAFNNPAYERMRITSSGIGIGTTAPSSSLHVSGTIRLSATPSLNCDANRLGAIKYESNNFMVCRQWHQLGNHGRRRQRHHGYRPHHLRHHAGNRRSGFLHIPRRRKYRETASVKRRNGHERIQRLPHVHSRQQFSGLFSPYTFQPDKRRRQPVAKRNLGSSGLADGWQLSGGISLYRRDGLRKPHRNLGSGLSQVRHHGKRGRRRHRTHAHHRKWCRRHQHHRP